MAPTIRPYRFGDVTALVALSLRAWAPVHASLEQVLGDAGGYRQMHPDWRVDQRAAVEAACADEQSQVWVAVSRGEGGGGEDGEGSDGEGSDGEGSDGEGSDGEGSDAEGSDGEGSDAEGSDAGGSDAGGSDGEGSDAEGGDHREDDHGEEAGAGEVVGFVVAVLDREPGLGEITMVAVDPAHQGRGIGSALTSTALTWLEDQGMTVAMVETGGDAGHAPARRLYERAGFVLLPVARYFRKL